jgi:putative spermidine/putrescine transport system substrate-binding protein
MELTRNVEWDLFEAVPSEYLILAKAGMLEKIDYSQIDKTTLAQYDPKLLLPDAFPFLAFTQVISYSTKTYSKDHHPQSWADVWDVEKFPGKRIFPAGDYIVEPLEPALLADGVAPDKLYPIDFERAYKSLSRIKPAVIKWVNSSSAVPQALVDGEADIGMASEARVLELRNSGAPIDFDWNQGLISSDYWAILKGAKHYQNAMKFIDFASQAKILADFIKILPFGPQNHATFDYLSPELKAALPTAPDNLRKQIRLNAEWWGDNGGSGPTNFEKSMKLWSQWITAQ